MDMNNVELPAPVRTYLEAAGRGDADAAAGVFAVDATVTDEGRTHRGRPAIRAWRARASAAYTVTTRVTGTRREGDDVWVVSVHLRGDFPGGEVDLDERFTVRDGAVTDLTFV